MAARLYTAAILPPELKCRNNTIDWGVQRPGTKNYPNVEKVATPCIWVGVYNRVGSGRLGSVCDSMVYLWFWGVLNPNPNNYCVCDISVSWENYLGKFIVPRNLNIKLKNNYGVVEFFEVVFNVDWRTTIQKTFILVLTCVRNSSPKFKIYDLNAGVTF